MSAADFFFATTTNVSGEYEKIMMKIKNAKRYSTTKMNALEKYLLSWNRKNEDGILLLQKNMIYSKVTSDIDAVNKIAMTLEGYLDLILTTAEKIDDKHGLDEVPLREQHEKLEQREKEV